MGLLDTMKKVAEGTQNAGVPAAYMFGTVTKTSPLTIRVDNRFDISGVKDSPTTEAQSGGSGDASFASHSHVLKNNYQTNTDGTSEYYYGLAVGEKVVLLRNQGGQSFLVLGRV